MQYPSCPAGRRGWRADAHGRASPAAGTGWPTGLVAPLVKDTNRDFQSKPLLTSYFFNLGPIYGTAAYKIPGLVCNLKQTHGCHSVTVICFTP